jgi:hypothetical protein
MARLRSVVSTPVDTAGQPRRAGSGSPAGARRRWKLEDALAERSEAWRAREPSPINELYNKERRAQFGYVHETFLVRPEDG